MTERRRADAVLLAALVLWAAGLSLESLWRRPGIEAPPALPPRLLVEGKRFEQQAEPPPAQPPGGPLPGGMTVPVAADYRAADGSVMALRWLSLTSSSGHGVSFGLASLPELFLGPGASGHCQLDGLPGSGARPLSSDADLMAALAERNPRGFQRLAWLLGLRPFRSNACLWVGSPGR
jgi:hypothetical protein